MGDDRTRALLVDADGYDVVEGAKATLGACVAEELATVVDE